MLTGKFDLRTSARSEMLDLTAQVSAWLRQNGAREGMLTLYCPHTTGALTINEGYDPDVCGDMLSTLERLVPKDPHYRHAEGNSDSHVKATLVGASVRVPVREGAPQLGRWQAIFFCEFDGPRRREVELCFEGAAR